MNRAFRTGLLALTAFVIVPGLTAADAAESRIFKTELVKLRAEILADGLVHPWGMAFLPDGAVLVTERPGRLRIFSKGRLSRPIPGVPKVYAHGQGGLLDVALAKDFAQSGTIFLSFAQAGHHGAGTAIARARFVRSGDHARLEDSKIIFSTRRKTGDSQYGSRIGVDRDGSLFVTTGDGGQEKRAQNFFDAAGSVLHINPDGSVPADNPFRDGKKGLPQIWSKGHRNIEGAAIDPTTDKLWTVEHGAKGGDELNHPEAGKNYGWPIISYGTNYDGTKIGIGTHAPGYEQPVYYWDPSIAPSGLAIYGGSMFPEWRGDFLVGALKFELVARLHRNASGKIVHEERMFKRAFGRIRDVRQAPDGSVWLLTDEENGAIIRLSRAG
jgi:glucose/arabinose dehydrogenase